MMIAHTIHLLYSLLCFLLIATLKGAYPALSPEIEGGI